jgi:hypothetical protein
MKGHVLATILLLGLGAVLVRAAEVRVYEQEQGGEISRLELGYSVQPDGVLIASQSESETYFTRAGADGDTRQWQVWGEAAAVEAQRRDQQVRVRGRNGSGELEYSFALEGLPWYQALSYALGQWLQREPQAERIEFWMIRPDTHRPVRLQARRAELQLLEIAGGTRQARRVEVRPDGWRGRLWSASYWFDARNGRFLRYESGALVPGVAETRIELRG